MPNALYKYTDEWCKYVFNTLVLNTLKIRLGSTLQSVVLL